MFSTYRSGGESMKDRDSISKRITSILFLIYFIVLTWIILFKMSFTLTDLPHLRGVNLIPFAQSVIVNGKMDVTEIVQNMIAFIPFGVYMCMMREKAGFFGKVAPAACVSLIYEILQFVFAIGATDITDLIANTLGGIAGCFIYTVFLKVLGKKTNKVLNILAGIGTVGIVVFLGIIIAVN